MGTEGWNALPDVAKVLQQSCAPVDDLVVSDQDLVVNRWRRYGKDRLYVETPDGAKVGFWDFVTETAHAESPEQEPSLMLAVANWKSSVGLTHTGSAPAPPVVEDSSAPSPTLVVDADSEPASRRIPDAEVNGDVAAAASISPAGERTYDSQDLDLQVPRPVTATAVPDIPVVAPVRPWVDLATNNAGAEARERAQAARDLAPVKTVLARVLGVHTNERAWRIGADGEEKVAAQLAKVAKKDPRWRFLHAIPVGNRGSDIDHIIIGPGGVFTANAKHHPGAKIWVGGNTFMVNGAKQPYIRNARHEAQRAARILADACGFPVPVEGLIVTVNATDVVIKSQPEGVSVVPRMQVAGWLLRHGDILAPATIDAIYEVARRSTTWRN